MCNEDIKNKAKALLSRMKSFGMASTVVDIHEFDSNLSLNLPVHMCSDDDKIWYMTSNTTHIEGVLVGWDARHNDWVKSLNTQYAQNIVYSGSTSGSTYKSIMLKNDEDLAMLFDWLCYISKRNFIITGIKDGVIDLSRLSNIDPGEKSYINNFWKCTDTVESMLIEADLKGMA